MAKHHRRLLASSVLATIPLLTLAAQAAPSGAHPRLFLDAATKQGLVAQAGDASSPVARGAARCSAARANPSDYSDGGWQGFEFLTTLSGCLASWEASGNSDDLATAFKYFSVLLDDYQTVGDGAGGDDVVSHDSGYAMRTFAPYSAIAYDWLHDAPGMTDDLRAHALERFNAWMSWYQTNGYLPDLAGANYEAGYAFAATMIAIAEGGEAGANGDAHWATVTNTIWGKDMSGGLSATGVLQGGDWAEGWQYGPLSVLEHALSMRALADNGVNVPGAGPWADSLVTRFANDLTPVSHQVYAAGDSDNTSPNRDPDNGPLLATIAGLGSDQAKSWARKLDADLGLQNDNPLFDALAAARTGASSDLPSDAPTNDLATGTGNWYLRGNHTQATIWGVFQCSHRLVDDHQHNDAGNFVLTRGADDLVVDPSPYGTVSTMSSNAPAVDSNSLPSGYSPSQGYWGQTTKLDWARQSGSGVAAARCDYADQFRSDDVASDVAHALRDYVLVPDGDSGEVVLIDRVVTGDASRALHLRVRTPGSLALGSNRATATVGASTLSVEEVYASSGSPSVRDMPQGTECDSSDHTCDLSRIPAGTEYRLDVSGPNASAIHVVAARGANASVTPHTALSGDGYRGVVIPRAGSNVAVVANTTPDGSAGGSFAYTAPAGALHVVVDAPVDANGKSDVSATQDGSNCDVVVTPHAGASDGFDGAPLIVALDSKCGVSDDGSQATSTPSDPTGGSGGGTATGSGGTGGSATNTGAQGGTATTATGGTDSSTGGADDGSGAQGGSASSSGGSSSSGSGAQGGSASSTGGTSGTSGTSGTGGSSSHRRRTWFAQWIASIFGTESTNLSTLSTGDAANSGAVATNAPEEQESGGISCSVASNPTGNPGGVLAGALVGLVFVLRQRRRRLLAD
ncbi:MAG TPA: MYXO-CTERM sorting domain-containing protein [Polyangiaceae bacterium]|nr:MYXO-CTERM sorting domain-containing protein [Polyangiaceae bacterium]